MDVINPRIDLRLFPLTFLFLNFQLPIKLRITCQASSFLELLGLALILNLGLKALNCLAVGFIALNAEGFLLLETFSDERVVKGRGV